MEYLFFKSNNKSHMYSKRIISVLLIILLLSLTACRNSENIVSDYTSSYGMPIISSIPSSEASSVSSMLAAPVDNGIRLKISSPTKNVNNVTKPEFTFSGTSDKDEPLTINGAHIERGENGIFTYTVNLKVGKNVFSFKHKGETKNYTVNYRYVIITDYSPKDVQRYRSGSTLVVDVTARKGSIVVAKFNNQSVNLSPTGTDDTNNEFISYNGIFTLPKDNPRDLNLGKIIYTATHNGKAETFYSGNIICNKSDIVIDYDPNATPKGENYINVGSGYIAEIVEYNAETFDGNVSNAALKNGSVDWSRPTNNYLPKGTLDYCSSSYINYKELTYVTLRAGYRVYLNRKDKPNTVLEPVVKQYIGTLPDHNEISISSFEADESHTVLTLTSLWKAPFRFKIEPQSYTNPSKKDYTVSNVTFNYIDITFCYATVFDEEIIIPEDNPIFKSAKIIENRNSDGTATVDYTLRLFLRKQGGFYGWDSYYNADNQLCFEFLNPKKINVAENEYGVNLSGAKILIDVGHGGKDPGACTFDSKNHNEAIQNLLLANKIKAELLKTGATVYSTREDNRTSTTDDKITMLKKIKPDYCIAVHHNSNDSGTPNGFDSYYFHSFSKKAAEYVFEHTRNTGTSIYKKFGLDWHYYFMARVSNCPVVLTENGYMSNKFDYGNIINDTKNTEKAIAITKGIAEYFKSIQ